MTVSEVEKGHITLSPAHSQQILYWGHPIGVISTASPPLTHVPVAELLFKFGLYHCCIFGFLNQEYLQSDSGIPLS